jgi:hypothetical protein
MLDDAHPILKYWRSFRTEFAAFIRQADHRALAIAWTSSTERTKFYRDNVFPGVARALNLDLRPELFRRDFAMRVKSSTGQLVPLIFVESENVASTAYNEMEKLCALCAPLRVLITVVEWDETPGVWRSGGKRSTLVATWQAIVAAHGEVWPQPGVTGVIVGEWRNDTVLRFYALGFDPRGTVCDPESIIFERRMNQANPDQEMAATAPT